MRLNPAVFALSLGLLTAAVPALAQDQPTGETPAQRAARRAAMPPPVLEEDQALKAAIASPSRSAADTARDSQRHPYETLTFWGLNPGQTIVEIEPGRAGWWRNILQPYAAATGGTYVAVDKPTESMGVADGSADLIVVARAFHNWSRDGRVEPYLAAFFKALKPGGVLAVEQHRSVDGLNVATTAPTGYVPESYVIRAAQAAGFVLDARSEINANPKDNHDHPFGVWTLPPIRQSAARDGTGALTPAQRAELDAIGESDRMTLRFRKPG
jgi:predicted methyltransferase